MKVWSIQKGLIQGLGTLGLEEGSKRLQDVAIQEVSIGNTSNRNAIKLQIFMPGSHDKQRKYNY